MSVRATEVLSGELELTRADALKLGAVGAALAAVPALAWLGGGDGAPEFLRRSTFDPLVGSAFVLTAPNGQTIGVRLASVENPPGARRGPPREQAFSLLFRGERRAGAEQGSYRIAHPRLRPFELFVVPVGRGVHGQTYQAIVNRTLG